jgi:iron complex outermembrane receptor protein
MKYGLIILAFVAFNSLGQITGKVIIESKEPVVGAKLIASNGEKAISNYDGNFQLNATTYPITIITTMLPYMADTTVVNGPGNVVITMREAVLNLGPVVVSANRRQQAIEEVPVSMEIIRPQLIDNKGMTDLEQAVDQTPGVFTMDGQVSIRGGSGFAYGTGSRVLLLWNGMPLLSGYAGDTQWNAIPMEQAAQIEVMKGAASVLYGSGALNGVIALAEKEPNLKPETKVKVQYGIYGNPARESLNWWKPKNQINPMNQQVEVYRGQMFQRVGYTISSTFFHNDGYRDGETEFRGRVSGTLYFKFKKYERLKAGIGYNFQMQRTGNFLIWESDSLAYTPSGGADVSDSASTLTFNLGKRLFIDPYVRFTDKHNNKHSLKTRMYFAENANLTNPSQSNSATVYFSDYQIQREFRKGATITAGVSNIFNSVSSNLMGDHTSNNAAIYGQYEQKIGKLDITGGLRAEYFQMDGKSGDSDFIISKKNGTKIPVYPVIRLGLHYQVMKYTHLRASFGQGIRYPSVAERYTRTSVGALNIFPNAALRPEIGWAGEIGIKQGVKMGDWKGMIDVSGFINQYSNMIEFSFGCYNPMSGETINTQDTNFVQIYQEILGQGYTINDIFGFRAINAEKARISGIDASFNSMGKIGEVEIISLIGYTYMNPISLNNDPAYRLSNSDTTQNLLKYRFKHLAKADVEVNYKKMSFGISMRYNSYMSNIDRVFEEAIAGGTYVLPGLKEYRQIYNKGNFVVDARIGFKINESYRLGFMVNNVFNAEYSSRPGDIQPPRNFLVQVQMKF